MMSFRTILLIAIAFFQIGSSAYVRAQTGFEQNAEEEVPLTIIHVEILTQGIDAGPNPQRWGQAFAEIGLDCRIRQGSRDDVPEITEEQEGRVRRITVVGVLDGTGKIQFPDVSFTMADQVEFQKWFAELERYGVQGNPDGQTNWGLDEAQLIELLGHLGQPITAEVKGLPLRQVLDELPFPEVMTLREIAPSNERTTSIDAQSAPITAPGLDRNAVVVHEVQGLSLGTGLAVLLSEQGLGFQPLRNPDGSTDLQIIPLGGERKPWPIGWDIGDQTPRDQLFPTLFEFFPINIEDVSLSQTLSEISKRSEVPILVDYRECAAREIDLTQLRVTVVEPQSAWGLVIRRIVTQAKLTFDYRLDEADRPFIWIYPFVPYTPAMPE
jgi:hypothetical protein